MWSIWGAPSDLEYYDSLGADRDVDEPRICEDCGARWDRREACEDWCETNRPVPEPVPVSCLGSKSKRSLSSRGRQMIFRGWVTFRAASQADAQSPTTEPRRCSWPESSEPFVMRFKRTSATKGELVEFRRSPLTKTLRPAVKPGIRQPDLCASPSHRRSSENAFSGCE
jgi:hypothetical protein